MRTSIVPTAIWIFKLDRDGRQSLRFTGKEEVPFYAKQALEQSQQLNDVKNEQKSLKLPQWLSN